MVCSYDLQESIHKIYVYNGTWNLLRTSSVDGTGVQHTSDQFGSATQNHSDPLRRELSTCVVSLLPGSQY